MTDDEYIKILEETESGPKAPMPAFLDAKPVLSVEMHPPDSSEDRFHAMLQGLASNRLLRMSRKSAPAVVDPTGEARIIDGDLSLWIMDYENVSMDFNIRTLKLYHILTSELTRINDYRGESNSKTAVSISLDKMAMLMGKENTKSNMDKLRRNLRDSLDFLFNLSFTFDERLNGKKESYARLRMLGYHSIHYGCVTAGFTQEFTDYLRKTYIAKFPDEMWKMDERNPHSYFIAYHLVLHYGMDGNQAKGIAGILSIASVLAACPNLATKESLEKSNRAHSRRIVEPFLDALECISFIEFTIKDSQGAEYSREQLKLIGLGDFKNLRIHYRITGYVVDAERIEAKINEKGKRKSKV
jgi:hypothetical protein